MSQTIRIIRIIEDSKIDFWDNSLSVQKNTIIFSPDEFFNIITGNYIQIEATLLNKEYFDGVYSNIQLKNGINDFYKNKTFYIFTDYINDSVDDIKFSGPLYLFDILSSLDSQFEKEQAAITLFLTLYSSNTKLMRINSKIPRRSELIESAIDYIEKNITTKLNLETIADNLNISREYLSRLFRKEMKTSFLNYVNKKKMSVAKDLLLLGHKEDEVAEIMKYQSIQSFRKRYKAVFGITPKRQIKT